MTENRQKKRERGAGNERKERSQERTERGRGNEITTADKESKKCLYEGGAGRGGEGQDEAG